MWQACRPLLLATALATGGGAHAGAVSPFECSGDICGFNVTAQKLVSSPCGGYTVLVAYSRTTGATLIQCSKPGSPLENRSYAFDRTRSRAVAVELAGSRFIRPDFIAEAAADGIPDAFGPVPLCEPPASTATSADGLYLASKQPTDRDDAPYCYRLFRAAVSADGIALTTDGAAPADAAGKPDARWTGLARRLLPYIDASPRGSAPAGPIAPIATVSADKAVLYSEATPSARRAGYLIKGDQVEIIDTAKSASGWWKVRYLPRSGRPIERWIRIGDLAD